MTPTVSVILPTYNRARFLPEAFSAITSQSRSDWELLVIDDGSVDDTQEVFRRFASTTERPVRCLRQENAGPAAARSTGIANARGEYLAFLDSDDLWDPDYLATLVGALELNPDVDWAYAACRIEDLVTGRVLTTDTFRVAGSPRPFMQLAFRRSGELRVISDPSAIKVALDSGLYCGFQNSVVRARTFARWRDPIVPTRVGEDTLTVVRALAAGVTIGYVDRPLVRYRVHDANTSGSSERLAPEHVVRNTEEYDRGYAFLVEEWRSRPEMVRRLQRARGRRWFWTAGYAGCWQQGKGAEALVFFRQGLRHWPWSISMWKTYALARLRVFTGLA